MRSPTHRHLGRLVGNEEHAQAHGDDQRAGKRPAQDAAATFWGGAGGGGKCRRGALSESQRISPPAAFSCSTRATHPPLKRSSFFALSGAFCAFSVLHASRTVKADMVRRAARVTKVQTGGEAPTARRGR